MIAVGDVLRVVLSFQLPDSVIAQIVWHYQAVSGTPETPESVLTFVANNTHNAFAGILADMSDQVQGLIFDMLQWDYTNDRWDGVAALVTTSLDGTSIQDMLPHGVAPMVSFLTDLGRRRGRKYLPGWTENSITDGAWIAADLTQMGTFALIFDNDISSATLLLEPGNFNVDPLSAIFETFQPWNKTVLVNSFANYQRRRRPGVGI